MKKVSFVLILVLAGYACSQMGVTAPAPPGGNFCASGTVNAPCSILPVVVNEPALHKFGYTSFLDSADQTPVDVFSWQTFMALNWAADREGHPFGDSAGDYPNAPRVWEFYKDPSEVFGSSSAELLLSLGQAHATGYKFLYLTAKTPHDFSPIRGFEEADGHPLLDRNLNFALYEIKMNPAEADFVTTHQLTTRTGIYEYSKRNRFLLPPFTSNDTSGKTPATIEIKATWRILDPARGDDTSRFYCRRAIVFVDSLHSTSCKSFRDTVMAGLVGMHIVRKTPDPLATSLIWSTFEHIDNTPQSLQEAQQDRQRKWSFYNPNCLNCLPNDPPALTSTDSLRNRQYHWNPSRPHGAPYASHSPSQRKLDSFGTQVVRVYPVYYATENVNRLWQNRLKGTVWANYRLVGSQWQQGDGTNPPSAPAYLANTVLETYIQPRASCIGCHTAAAITFKSNTSTDTIHTDHSFIFPVYAR